jgi:hypothetical protein
MDTNTFCLLCSVFSKRWLVYAAGTNSDVCVRNYLYPVFLLTKTQPRGFYQWNFHQRHASPWLTGWPLMAYSIFHAISVWKIQVKRYPSPFFTYLFSITFIYFFISFMVFNATFNNISVIQWRLVLLVEETGAPGENHRPAASHWQTLSHNDKM